MYACLTNECGLMPTTCMQQARGCTLHYYGLTPDVDSDVDGVNQSADSPNVTLDEICCSSARCVRKPRLAFQQT
jgi:hypothetical protein